MDVLERYSAAEAIEKISAYDRRQEKIEIGDEVTAKTKTDPDMPKACVLYPNPDGTQYLVLKDDGTVQWWSKCGVAKTGRHFPQVAEVLRGMKEQQVYEDGEEG